MEKELLAKLNKVARETGKTHAALKQEMHDALFGEAEGLRKWVNFVKARLRSPSEIDLENRRIFEETRQREALAAQAAAADKALAAKIRVLHAVFGPDNAHTGTGGKAKAGEKSFTEKEEGRRKASAAEGQAEGTGRD